MSHLYQFESENYKDLQDKRLADLIDSEGDNEQLKQDLAHFTNSIVDLIAGVQQHKIKNRGYVLLVSGTWGAGKTSATWALANEVSAKLTTETTGLKKLLIIEKSLLPFGSTNESILTFLHEFAETLWSKSLIDVRSEIKRFMLEVTPDAEARYSLSATIGPLNLSRSINSIDNFNADKLRAKFSRLAKLHSTVLIILDDLDRLRPSEIVDVLRMVEKLRALPNVIVILPIYKKVITDAFENDLHLSPASASTFLRKLTDAEVFIENNIKELKRVFLANFDGETANDFEPVLEQQYGLSIGDLCWTILLHNIVLEEATAYLQSAEVTAERVTEVFDKTKGSQYLHQFRNLLSESTLNGTEKPYPVHFDDGSREVFRPLGDYYENLEINRTGNPNMAATRLTTLLNYDDVNKAITKDAGVIQSVANHQPREFELQLQVSNSSPMLIEVLIPLLLHTESEPFLTSNYKLRDMKILARMIKGDPDFFAPHSDPIRIIYQIVQDSYRRFRF